MSEPEFYSFRQIEDPYRASSAVLTACKEASEIQKSGGATWFRATVVDDGVWIEGWLVRPEIEPPFNPPMVPA